MIGLQLRDGVHQFLIAGGAHQREHVLLLVLVVGRRGDVEVAHHVARRAHRHLAVARRVAGFGQVRDQTRQQLQRAIRALVAGREHLERLVEASGG